MALRILRLLVELNKLGATVLIATHDEDLIARSGMPMLRLEGGRLSEGHARGPLDEEEG
jgi:cell division transport system ATP-binding protein